MSMLILRKVGSFFLILMGILAPASIAFDACGSHRLAFQYRRPSNSVLYESAQSPVAERLGLRDRFDRWRFLQNLLDEELPAEDVNEILYAVLQGYMKDKVRRRGEEGSPELTVDLRTAIEKVFAEATDEGRVQVLSPDDNTAVLSILEAILPDPVEDEDGHKSTWDIVMDLHGREGIKLNEREGRLEWKQACMAARVLIYYDFLTEGIPA